MGTDVSSENGSKGEKHTSSERLIDTALAVAAPWEDSFATHLSKASLQQIAISAVRSGNEHIT